VDFNKRMAAVAGAILVLLVGAVALASPVSGQQAVVAAAALPVPGDTVPLWGTDPELSETGTCEVEVDGELDPGAGCETVGFEDCTGSDDDKDCKPADGSYSANVLVPEREPGILKVKLCSDVCGDSSREYDLSFEIGSAASNNVVVPGVLGNPLEEALAELESAKFVGVLSDDSPATGAVVSQIPRGGDLAEAGSKVVLVLAGELIPVPNLIGATAREAAVTVSELDLVLSPKGTEDDFVIDQHPEPGEGLAAGGVVVVEYSTMVLVPDILGAQLGAARTSLDALDLTLIIDGTILEGKVKNQTPTANTRVKPGSGVTVTLETLATAEPGAGQEGVPPAPTGELNGGSTATASTTPVITPGTNTSLPADAPTEGAIAPSSQVAGSASVTAGTAPSTTESDLIAVPTLLGLRRAEAESAATAAGLGVSVGGDLDGVVIEQVPAAGDAIQRGSIVSVNLSSVIPVEQDYWYLPPLLVLAAVIGFAGGAAVLHQLQQRPRRTRWLSHHVAFRPLAHPVSKAIQNIRRKSSGSDSGGGGSGAHIPQQSRPDHDDPNGSLVSELDFNGRNYDLPDSAADHIVALVGHRHDSTLKLKEDTS